MTNILNIMQNNKQLTTHNIAKNDEVLIWKRMIILISFWLKTN